MGGESRDSRYIPNVLRLIREHRSFFLGATLAGFLLRLFFVVYFPAVTDDSRIYANLGANWLQHGVYGQSQGGQPDKPILATDARLPGYPAFLAAIFWIFGVGDFRAVLLAQVLVDIATCVIIGDLARRIVSDPAAKVAFVLTALCPFLASYAASVLSETLEVFFTALALDCAAVALDAIRNRKAGLLRWWAATGVATGACILLRPDGGILLAAVILYLLFLASRAPAAGMSTGSYFAPIVIVAIFALSPLVPWTIRNSHTLHHFQPLAPRYANETDEFVPVGFNRWTKTWIADYVSVEEIYWNVPGEKIDPRKLPARAIDNPQQREATLGVIDDYNDSQDMTPDLDARFGEIAAERIRGNPVRYYAVLPALRIADMWLRPRTELLPADPRWWEFHDDRKESVTAVGFGLLNLAYIVAALLALARRPSVIRCAGLLVLFLLLRSAFLGTLENPEPRYTLEGYPAVILFAASLFVNAPERKFE